MIAIIKALKIWSRTVAEHLAIQSYFRLSLTVMWSTTSVK